MTTPAREREELMRLVMETWDRERSWYEVADALLASDLWQRRERVVEAAKSAMIFLDFTVRPWLPNEHTNCGIDSGCSHGAVEREMFEKLDAQVEALAATLTPPPPQETQG